MTKECGVSFRCHESLVISRNDKVKWVIFSRSHQCCEFLSVLCHCWLGNRNGIRSVMLCPLWAPGL